MVVEQGHLASDSGSPDQDETVRALEQALEAASRAESRLREAIEVLPEGIVFLDEEGRYILWNQKYSEIYSKSADLLVKGARLADTLKIGIERGDYPEAIGCEAEWLAERLSLLEQPGCRHEQRLSNGQCIMIEERKTADGGTIGLRVDITELRQKEEAFRLLFERSPQPMLVYDTRSGLVRSANEAACIYLGYAADELQEMPARTLFPEHLWAQASEVLGTDSSENGRHWEMRAKGGVAIEAVISTRLSQLAGFEATIVSLFDITERRRIEERMAYMARHDELTDLANRAHCREHLHDVVQTAAPHEAVTIALIDLDHFKAVNDTFGHHYGDALLTEAAQRMRELLPPQALLCRIGGDEFAIIFRRSSRTQTELVAKSIITTLTEPFHLLGNVIHIGATIGFATAPYDSSDPETLLRYADLALYAAKTEKRGTCKSFAASMDAAAQEKNRLEKDLRHAVRSGALEIFYQPLVNLESERIECFEALLRWHHPERGAISPEVFIPLAEELGLIDQIGRFVLTHACQEAMTWPDHVKISVNVSPLQFRNGNLLSTVINALSSSGLPAGRLELEVTEAVLMEKGPRPAAILRNLRAFGIGISLDDFGTGYSSLSYLLNYPFTKIKIDKSFILNLHEDTTSRAVIRAVIGLGRSLGLTVAAEGVERELERDYLREEGCTQGQGYLYGRPQPSADAALVANGYPMERRDAA